MQTDEEFLEQIRQHENARVRAIVEGLFQEHKSSCNFHKLGLDYVHPCDCGAELYNTAIQTVLNEIN